MLHTFHIYWASTFLLPRDLIDEVDKLCLHFLWPGNQPKNKLVLVQWDEVCQPEKFGGLGLKKVELWNIAAVGKHVWCLAQKKDILWVKWISNVYLKGEDVWQHILKQNHSWYWRKLHDIKDQLAREQWQQMDFGALRSVFYSVRVSMVCWLTCALCYCTCGLVLFDNPSACNPVIAHGSWKASDHGQAVQMV